MTDNTSKYPQFFIHKPVKLIELFGGIGTQAMALRDIGSEFEHHRLVEFDIHAVRSYNAIHEKCFEPEDIRDIHGSDLGITDKKHFCYVMTYSFPCQDLSMAGKRLGMSKSSGTRSGLLWEVERILNECEELPDILLMENVPAVHAKANVEDFRRWIDFLSSKGYSSYWQDLNAKDYGVPQNRNRCFMLSFLGDYSYSFPNPVPLQKSFSDCLEESVSDRYTVRTERSAALIAQIIRNEKGNQAVAVRVKGIRGKSVTPKIEKTEIACTICTQSTMLNFGDNGVVEWQ